MTLEGEYIPSTSAWVRDQVELYESTGGKEGNTLRDTGLPVIIVTTRGQKSGAIRKFALMRVEHGGEYAIVASVGGAPKHPAWYHSVRVHPEVELQDGTERTARVARELSGEERAQWWERAVAAYPDYADYQTKTDRQIPVLVLDPIES